jgi:transcriptional regulator with PAS, ATPase and Fis domain
LPDVSLARSLLTRWWGLELGLTDASGGGADRVALTTKDTQALLVAPLGELLATAAKAKVRGAVVLPGPCGLVVVAAPVLTTAGVYGLVYASVARPTDGAVTVAGLAALIGCTEVEAAAITDSIPALDETNLGRVKDLVLASASAVERSLPVDVAPTTFSHPFTEIVGDAPAVRDVVKLLTKVVKSEATVLVHGESGTGKELIARAIHYHGPRAKKPFVVQNCSAFNDNLLESALFGHVRGAFTGAVKDQPGLFQIADNGTFFLDEIGDMSSALQVKLLRVLQEGTFTPVGGTKPVKVDVRIIAASHKDLATMVAHKQFREDLFYRVNVLKITVPPLRERAADIPRLAQHFVAKHWKQQRGVEEGRPAPLLSQQALARLVAYQWPGNIRELENEIERMLVLAGDATELSGAMVSTRVAGMVAAPPKSMRDALSTAEAETIAQAVGRHLGDRDTAAADLGVSRSYLDARCTALGLSTGGPRL